MRLIQQNVLHQFTQVYILDLQNNYIGDKAWALESREFEGSIAYSRVFVLKLFANQIAKQHGESSLPADVPAHMYDKMVFLYHYLMNFRSRFSKELKVKYRRRVLND